jgi:hypothetical protein
VRKVLAASIILVTSLTNAETTPNWVKVSTDEYGETFVDSNHLKRLPENKKIVEYGYKYIYKYGVPSLNIQPKGYIQAIHQINCAEKTKGTVLSQRFTPQGKSLDKPVPYDKVYFEPIYDRFEDLTKIYKFVCKTK